MASCANAGVVLDKVGVVENSEFSSHKYKQCKTIKGVVQREEIRESDICKYKLAECDETKKPWKTTEMFCVSETVYECYKNDLWQLENPNMSGFEQQKYPYVESRPKRKNGELYTTTCVHW